jgi:hypothetical protein
LTTEWRKSSRSGTENDKSCVELAAMSGGVAVRDSKAPEEGYISFVAADWRRFIGQVKADRYG